MSTAALRIVECLDEAAAGSGSGGAPPRPCGPELSPELSPVPARTGAARAPVALGPRGRRGGRRVRMVRSVVAEVEALRPVLEEAVQQYELRVTAQLAEILRALRGDSAALPHLPSVRTTTAMLRAIHSVELKPARGRPKDLVRLHELVAELTELLTPESVP